MKLIFIYLFVGLFCLAGGSIHAQNALLSELRVMDWGPDLPASPGLSASLFSRQYYGLSNWNRTGSAIHFKKDRGHSSLFFERDGIPGNALWQLGLSHGVELSKVSGFITLRFGFYTTPGSPVFWRVGADMAISAHWSDRTTVNLFLHDFPSFFTPSKLYLVRPPLFRMQLVHRAGRQADGALGFESSSDHFGPLSCSVRIHGSDHLWLQWKIAALPLSFSFGISYLFESIRVTGIFEFGSSLGITPTFIIHRPLK